MSQKNRGRERLDVLLVSRGMAESREQAKRLILAGVVQVAGIALPKPGQLVDSAIDIILKQGEKYVSRGGLKLEEALRSFLINLDGRVCADIGASTGGFTDCMLQHGAAKVYAVDVGASQMHERLQRDPRVTLVEHTNAKDLDPHVFPERPDFAAVDVSFISILRVTASLSKVIAQGAEAVFLVKPQFEAGREEVSRGRGVIKDPDVHRVVLQKVIEGLLEQGWQPEKLVPSPIKGGSGNIEFLCFCRLGSESSGKHGIDIDEAVRSAGANLQ